MNRSAAFVLFALLAAPAAAQAPGLTVKTGESWIFSLYRGQPVHARKSNPGAKPAPGKILVTVRSLMGTTMSISSANDIAYTYRAELIGGDKKTMARSCTLPADGKLSFEHWPERADAVRLSNFEPAPKGGNCP